MYSNLVLLFSFVFACFCCVFAIPTLNRLTVHPGDREYVPPQCGGDQDSGYGNICVNDTHCGPEGKCVYIYMVYACLCHQCKASPEGCCPKQLANCRDDDGIGRWTPCTQWDKNGNFAHNGCVKGNVCNGLYARQCRCKNQTTTTRGHLITSTITVPSTKTTGKCI